MSLDELAAGTAAMDGMGLRRLLAAELPTVSPEGLLDEFTWATVTLLVEGAMPKLEGHDVARMLRGALWPQLVATASDEARDGRACPEVPPCLLDLLWNDYGRMSHGREIPKPWLIRAGQPVAAAGQHRTVVEFLLFGLAAARCEEVADALSAALEAGVGPARQPWTVMDGEIMAHEGIDALALSRRAVIELASPLKLPAAAGRTTGYDALLLNLIDRVDGLALWHGRRLDCDFAGLKAAARAVSIIEEEVEMATWHRRSGRSGATVPSLDLRGVLQLSGDLRPLAPFLTLLPICHAGKDVRMGHGWCHVTAL